MGAIETLKEVVALVQKIDNIEIVKQVLALQTQVQELDGDNQILKRRVVNLEGLLEFAKQLEFRAPFYRSPGDDTPYCARCWEVNKKAVHVISIYKKSEERWDCPECKQMYLTKGTGGGGQARWGFQSDD